MNTTILGVLAVAVFGLLATGCTSLGPTVTVVHDEVYPAAGLASFALENRVGAVTVTGWDRDEVRVRAVNGRGVKNVSVEVAADRMMVRVLPADGIDIVGPQARFEISVPRSLARIDVATSNGPIEVRDYDGTVDAATSNGAILLAGTRSIERLQTSNGAIEAELRALDVDARATTSNGAVRLLLAPSLNATVEARTSNGRVTVTDLPFTATVERQNEVRGTLGGGGPRLLVTTSNGQVTIGSL